MKIISRKTILGIFIIIIGLGELIAQESETVDPIESKWTFLVEPYIMFPNMNGSVGVGLLPDIIVDASTNNIFNNLKMGFMLNMEATNGKWTIGSDVLYMKLGEKIASKNEILGGDITAKQFGWEISGLYRVTPWLELGLGGLVNSINTGVDLNRKQIGGEKLNMYSSKTETWFDPMLITRIKSKPEEKFVYMFRGEIGGLGIGSNLAWQIQAYAGYKFSKLFEITGGYRIISLDYESGNGEDRFMYNVDTSGPVIRFGFRF